VSWLTEPLAFGFFRHGLIVATLAGALCGLIGVYVTLRGMSYIGHGLSHAIFGGAAASALISLNFYIGAGVWGMASALAIGRVTRRRIIGSDAAIGVITTASFAFGIALLGFYGQVRKSIDAALFGSILGVSLADVWVRGHDPQLPPRHLLGGHHRAGGRQPVRRGLRPERAQGPAPDRRPRHPCRPSGRAPARGLSGLTRA